MVLTFDSDFESAFSVSASFCEIQLEMEAEPTSIEAKLAFDSSAQTLTLSQFSDSLDLSGSIDSTSTDYMLTFTYSIFSPYQDQPVQSEAPEIFLTIKNPCVDTNFVTIPALDPAITDQNYIVFDDAATFQHAAFTVATTPITHTLCGDVTLTVQFDGVNIGAGEDVVSYDEATRTFTVDSDDADLIGETKAYSITAELANYPTIFHASADTQTLTKNIVFQNPCLDPFTFAATQQTSPSDYVYSGTLDFSLATFTMEPSICEVTYTC